MTLLAKSEPQITLKEHIDDCLKIWIHLQECFPHISSILSDFDFWQILRLAVITHDLGKGHQEFVKLLEKKQNDWEGQRHELFSLPFIETLEVEPETKQLLKLVVAGHHKDFETLQGLVTKTYSSGNTDEFGNSGLLDYKTEFKKVLVKEVGNLLKTEFGIDVFVEKVLPPGKIISVYLSRSIKGESNINNANYFKLLLLFGALKHCDHLGSAQVDYLEQLTTQSFLYLKNQQALLHTKGSDFYHHQSKSKNTNGNVILTAPTGSGKTESAMLWLEQQMKVFGQGRAFYILPFTASINAMYERLSSNEDGLGTEKVGMIHGKLQDYLYDYLDTVQYDSFFKKEEIGKIKDKFKSVYTPLKVVTPFQLLKHLFGLKGFEQGIFEWIGGYFIFDEIHAYSPEVFAQIKVFLEHVVKHLRGKVFIMTATLPSFLKTELEQAVGTYTAIIAEDSLYDKFTRHRVIVADGLLKDNLQLIEADVNAGNKVLVVCNTIVQAQEVYKRLHSLVSKSVLLHSAFTGEDRTRHEKDLKDGEKDEQNPIYLLVGTQAIEVSLDIDYDIIYTEPAPIDALIQRFGRVNRKREKGICPVVIFDKANKNDHFIYDTKVIESTISVLREIVTKENGIIKEKELQKYIDFVYPRWNEKNEQLFKTVYNALKYTVENQLIPLLHSKKQEEDFYKQFDGIKVLPITLKDRYENYLKDFDFIGAERLKVQIRKNKFAQLTAENDQNLYKTSYIFYSEKGKRLEVIYWVITKKYDPLIGLIYNEQEIWNAEIW